MPMPKLTLAVTNANGDVFKLFRVRRDDIQSVAAAWERAIRAQHAWTPHVPDDPVHHACKILRDMMEDDLPTDPFMGTAAIYLLSKSPDGDGPTVVVILEDGFEIEPANDEMAKLIYRATSRTMH